MDPAFPIGPGSSSAHHNNMPRQQEYNQTIGKWTAAKLKANLTPKCKIFFHNGQDTKRRSQGSILSYRKHAFRLLYQTTAGLGIQKDVGPNPKSALHQKLIEHTGVCLRKAKMMGLK